MKRKATKGNLGKIGMCCACGGSFAMSATRMYEGFEYCLTCLDLMGIDWE